MLAAGMVVALHPQLSARGSTLGASLGATYHLDPAGPIPLSSTALDLSHVS